MDKCDERKFPFPVQKQRHGAVLHESSLVIELYLYLRPATCHTSMPVDPLATK